MIRDDKLEVFEFFQEDRSLPKFQKPGKKRDKMAKYEDDSMDEDSDSGVMMSNPWTTNMVVRPNVINLGTASSATSFVQLVPYGQITEVKQEGPSFWSKLAFWRKPPPPALPPPEPEGISVLEFFTHLKNNQEELKVVEARAKGYERAIANALQARQHALVEQLQAGLNAYAMETQLVALGLPKFLTEETVVKFVKQAKKGLRLDWVRNFGRTIPEAIVAKMTRANELGNFDNYVVLHYDPHAKSYAETEAEKAAKRDPILFGLMKGRRVLYVVGDWIDEVCDLTLDQIAEQLGRSVVESLAEATHPYRDT